MKNILLIVLATTLPAFAADMNFTPKADISLSGKIATAKNSKNIELLKLVRHFALQEHLVLHLLLILQKEAVLY